MMGLVRNTHLRANALSAQSLLDLTLKKFCTKTTKSSYSETGAKRQKRITNAFLCDILKTIHGFNFLTTKRVMTYLSFYIWKQSVWSSSIAYTLVKLLEWVSMVHDTTASSIYTYTWLCFLCSEKTVLACRTDMEKIWLKLTLCYKNEQ